MLLFAHALLLRRSPSRSLVPLKTLPVSFLLLHDSVIPVFHVTGNHQTAIEKAIIPFDKTISFYINSFTCVWSSFKVYYENVCPKSVCDMLVSHNVCL